MGVRMLDEFLKQRAKDPPFRGEIVFQPMAPHCWGPPAAELFDKIVRQIDTYATGRGPEELEVLMLSRRGKTLHMEQVGVEGG